MTWICARKATEEDNDILNERAQAFIDRHDLQEEMSIMIYNNESHIWRDLEYYLDERVETSDLCDRREWRYLQRLWERVFARATQCPGCTSIAWGHVGYSGD